MHYNENVSGRRGERKHSSKTRITEGSRRVTGLGLWLGLAPLLLARPRPEPFGRPLLRPVPRWGVGGASRAGSMSPIVLMGVCPSGPL